MPDIAISEMTAEIDRLNSRLAELEAFQRETLCAPVAIYRYEPMKHQYGVEWMIDEQLPNGTKLYVISHSNRIEIEK